MVASLENEAARDARVRNMETIESHIPNPDCPNCLEELEEHTDDFKNTYCWCAKCGRVYKVKKVIERFMFRRTPDYLG